VNEEQRCDAAKTGQHGLKYILDYTDEIHTTSSLSSSDGQRFERMKSSLNDLDLLRQYQES
jgi:hypothetical protein